MSTWVDNTRLFFWKRFRDSTSENKKENDSEDNVAVNYAELLSTATSEPFSFNNGETTLGVQFEPNIVPTKLNVELHQYLNLMNDNKCSTRLYFGLTMEECQQLWKAKVSNITFPWQKATGFNWLAMWPSRIAINNWLTTRRTKVTSTRRRTTRGFGFQHLIVLCHY